jgi:hypothetical protein
MPSGESAGKCCSFRRMQAASDLNPADCAHFGMHAGRTFGRDVNTDADSKMGGQTRKRRSSLNRKSHDVNQRCRQPPGELRPL